MAWWVWVVISVVFVIAVIIVYMMVRSSAIENDETNIERLKRLEERDFNDE